jgi:putative membrane-bound dehydrogenase-like protein
MQFRSFPGYGVWFMAATFLATTGLPAADRRGNSAAAETLPTPEEVAKMKPVNPEKAAAALKEVKFPEEFEVSIFATPPAVNYPVFLAAAPDGTVYVSSDGNGSLDRKEHRGRILRVRDLDGDGKADEVKVFVADVDSPRGLVWDHDRLYLLHPPHISEFIDRDGDGVAEEKRVLVKNIAFGFKDRPADHSSNGLELGVDGWLYAAIGDFGFLGAEGTDGRKLQLRGGGVVRVRPDGTGLELFARGTRNILEVAVSPLLDAFARDNTNDGGGWDVRLHHFTGFEDHGYPRLFKNFTNEIIQPLADYGGGSGCGAAWIDETGIPAKWNNAPFTADWGRSWVYHHGVVPNGATFTAEQKQFIGMTRVTDLDVDASSRIYVASWKGATFTWAGNDVGYLVQAKPKGFAAPPWRDFAKSSDAALVKLLESTSHRTRLEAQRTLLRRGLKRGAERALVALARDAGKPLASRVAALFTLKQGLKEGANTLLTASVKDPQIGAWAIRALTDRQDEMAKVKSAPLLETLKSDDARTRREAVAALGRWHGLTGAAADGGTPQPARFRTDDRARHTRALFPLLTDRDPVVAHTTLQVMRQLRAAEVCLASLDSRGTDARERAAALRVLQGIPESGVVDGVIARLSVETDPQRRAELLTTLCRLHFVEGKWSGTSWGTRPDTRGPFFQPEEWSETAKIGAELNRVMARAEVREAAFLAGELERHRIQSDAALDRLLGLVAKDSSVLPVVVSQLAGANKVTASALPLLVKTVTAAETTAEIRGKAVEALAKAELDDDAARALLAGLALLSDKREDRESWRQPAEAFLNSSQVEKRLAMLETEAAKVNGGGSRWADAALIRIADRNRPRSKAPGRLERSLLEAWSTPQRRAQLIEASILAGRKTLAEKIVAALKDSDATVADAAQRAVRRLRLDLNPEGAGEPLVGSMKVEDAIALASNTRGDASLGEQVFTRAGCVACHTVRADDPLKGPFLGNIATIYKRRELAEAVLIPNKSLAQGFVANRFEFKDGEEVEGFVVQEAADVITIRNVAAQELKIKPADIAKREKLEKSLMPEGLAAALTVKEFASLLDYLESLVPAGK